MRYIFNYKNFKLNESSVGINTNLSDRIASYESSLPIHKDVELSSFDDIIKILERDCSEFINELVSSGGDLLFRGIKSLDGVVVEDEKSIDGLWVKSARRDRRTLDTNPDVSDLFDDMFEDKFGMRLRRQGVFATKDPQDANTYSKYHSDIKKRKSYIFFPIGYYEYFWSPKVYDLFSDIEREKWYLYYNFGGSDFEYEWSYLYGDPRKDAFGDARGYFKLFGKKIPSSVIPHRIPSYIIDNYEKFGLEKTDSDSFTKDGKVILHKTTIFNHISELEWVPDMELGEYIEDKKADVENEVYEIVKNYKKDGLDEIKRQEIIFNLSTYYVVDEKYYFKIKEWIKSKVK